MPAPMYVLSADLSSLVIRLPRIGYDRVIEPAISRVRQDGIPMCCTFWISGSELKSQISAVGDRRYSNNERASLSPRTERSFVATARSRATLRSCSVRIAYDCVDRSHAQRIQTGAVLRDDGSRGVCRVRSDGVLHASRRARQNRRATGGILDWRESGRASAARRKVAESR